MYLQKYGASLTDFTYPVQYINGVNCPYYDIAYKGTETTGAAANPPAPPQNHNVLTTTINGVPFASDTTGTGITSLSIGSFCLPIDPTVKPIDFQEITITALNDEPSAVSDNPTRIVKNSVYSETITKTRMDEYYDQLRDLIPTGKFICSPNNTTAPSTYVRKMVVIPSNYLRNGQLIYLNAEPLEMRFTLNNIDKILTVIHCGKISTDADISHFGAVATESSLDYTIRLRNICLNVCLEEMPSSIINQLNARWTDPTVGIVKDFIKCTTVTMNNLLKNNGTKQVLQVIQNDIHHLKHILIVFRNADNDNIITKDRYQFSDGARVGDCDPCPDNPNFKASTFISVQYQVGIDFFPQQAIEFKRYNREEILNYTNEVLFVGDNSFIDNMLTHPSYCGEIDWNRNRVIQTDNNNLDFTVKNEYDGYVGGMANKFMIGYDFSRHHHSLRSGISLESRPLNIILETDAPLDIDLIPTVFLFHEATFTTTPQSASLMT